MNPQTSLLDLPPIAGPRKCERDRWLDRVRAELLRRYAGRDVTSDQAWHVVEHTPGLERPASVHPNSLGTIFSAWGQADPVMVGQPPHRMQAMRASCRPKAHGNLLRVWRLT